MSLLSFPMCAWGYCILPKHTMEVAPQNFMHLTWELFKAHPIISGLFAMTTSSMLIYAGITAFENRRLQKQLRKQEREQAQKTATLSAMESGNALSSENPSNLLARVDRMFFLISELEKLIDGALGCIHKEKPQVIFSGASTDIPKQPPPPSKPSKINELRRRPLARSSTLSYP